MSDTDHNNEIGGPGSTVQDDPSVFAGQSHADRAIWNLQGQLDSFVFSHPIQSFYSPGIDHTAPQYPVNGFQFGNDAASVLPRTIKPADLHQHHPQEFLPQQKNSFGNLRPLLPKAQDAVIHTPDVSPRSMSATLPHNSDQALLTSSSQTGCSSNQLGPQTFHARSASTNMNPYQSATPGSQATNALQTSTPVANRWQQARDYRHRIHQRPYRDSRTDTSIAEVEQQAEFWVQQLYSAVVNTQNVKDRDSSHALKIFLPNCYDPLLIESTCREIFTSLIERCKLGFRGPAQFNKALKTSRELCPDAVATCEDRLQNIIRALTWNKRVCKDVLYEDWKIRLLVNHPLSYDKDKDSQKGSNDHRKVRQQQERERLKETEAQLRAYRRSEGCPERPASIDGMPWDRGMSKGRETTRYAAEGSTTKRKRSEEAIENEVANTKEKRKDGMAVSMW